MRLGELLVRAGLVTVQEIELALRAQVVWGGRLGTNLVEQHLIDLDTLARVVGRQHQLPAALAKHFEAADRDLQRQLAPELAAQLACVPLRRVGDDRVAIASVAPLDGRARALVADQLGISYKGLIAAIAPELRIHYQLERVYGIPRAPRFLRSRKRSPIPAFELDGGDADDAEPPPTPPSPEPEPADAVPEELLPDFTPRIDLDDPPTADRRHYLRTLGDDTGPIAVGRIELKRQAIEAKAPATLDDALLALRRSNERDAIAERVIDAIARFVPGTAAAMLLVVRGQAATSWTQWTRSGEAVPPIAVPLDQPNLVSSVQGERALLRGARAPVDVLLLHTLGAPDTELVVSPIAIGSRVWSMVALAVEPGADVALLEPIGNAASVAFARLLRHANR